MGRSYIDILGIPKGIIVTAVSPSGELDGGLNSQLAKKYQKIIEPYQEYCKDRDDSGIVKLGDVILVQVSPGLFIAFAFCINQVQKSKGFEEIAFQTCLDTLESIVSDFSEQKQNLQLYFPYKMGSGILGGNWRTIEKLIEEKFPQISNICIVPHK
jgi:hypothetical protein